MVCVCSFFFFVLCVVCFPCGNSCVVLLSEPFLRLACTPPATEEKKRTPRHTWGAELTAYLAYRRDSIRSSLDSCDSIRLASPTIRPCHTMTHHPTVVQPHLIPDAFGRRACANSSSNNSSPHPPSTVITAFVDRVTGAINIVRVISARSATS